MRNQGVTRRQCLAGSAAVGMAGWLATRSAQGSGPGAEGDGYRLYFGDLHNHNSVGYAQGSLGRTFEIARNHLDFFAFTPHGWWPDIGRYENHIEDKWLKGFDVTRDRWPEVLEMARKFDAPGTFVPIVGFEWHSTHLGDYHILFPTLEGEYRRFDDLRAFQQFARERRAIMIPHHPANRLNHRGADPAQWDPQVSPLLEIFSEWGCAEHDRAPSPYIRHTEGGRWTRNTLERFLEAGHRPGVVAGTDDHLGYPGAYREGLAAVLAARLDRESIFDALRNRRTYALTGDRIGLDFRLNRRLMGQELPYARQRELAVAVTGWDQVDRVEVLKNNRVLHRDFPMDRRPAADGWGQPVLVRFEYGWGPWPALHMDRVCDWDIGLAIDGGVLEAVQPCFGSAPLDEDRRDRIAERSERRLRVQSFTARRDQFEDNSTKAVVLKVRGGPETRITVSLESPARVSLSQTFQQLAESGEMLFTGDFPKESAMLHRLVFHDHYHTSFTVSDADEGDGVTWYYVRAVQANGQMAWSSPIWVERRPGP
jgi:hypothetical protein